MGDLRTTVSADATSFNAALATSKSEAERFAREMEKLDAKNSASAAKAAAAAKREFTNQGKTVRTGVQLGSSLSSVVGMGSPQAGMALNALTSGFISLKEASTELGISMLKAAGTAAVFVATGIQLSRLAGEISGWMADLKTEREASSDALNVQLSTFNKYNKAIIEAKNRGQISKDTAKELLHGIASPNMGERNKAFARVRDLAGVSDPKLQDALRKAEIDAMKPGKDKDIAASQYEYDKKIQELQASKKGKNSTDSAIIDRIIEAAGREQALKDAELVAKYSGKKSPTFMGRIGAL